MLYIKNQIRIQPQIIYQTDKALTVSASLIALVLILIGSIMSNPLIVYAQGEGSGDSGGGGDDDDNGGDSGGGDDEKLQEQDNQPVKNAIRPKSTLSSDSSLSAAKNTFPSQSIQQIDPNALSAAKNTFPSKYIIQTIPPLWTDQGQTPTCDPSIETCSLAVPQPGPAVDISETKADVIESKDYLDSQPPEKRTKFLNNIVDNMAIPDTRQDLVESKMFLDRLSPTARAEILYLVINSMSKSFKMLPDVQAQSYQPSTLPKALPISTESSVGTTPQQLEQHGDAIILSPEIRQEISTKYSPSERAKIIPAAQNLGFAITAIIPGSAVIVDLTERTQLQTLLNQVEVQKFLELHDKPTAENLAAFLNIPLQKLGEFLNMLTPDELNEIFYKVLPEDAGNKILSSITADEQIKIKEKLQSIDNSNL